MDEMLSVADGRFRATAKKILHSMMQDAHGVVIASHSMATIVDSCNRTIVMHKGEPLFDGPSEDAVDFYSEIKQSQ